MGWNNQAVTLIVLTEEISGYSGIFGYSPAPAVGNLIFSVAAAAGTDPYGNAYLAGITSYNDLGGLAQQVVNLLDGAVGLNVRDSGGAWHFDSVYSDPVTFDLILNSSTNVIRPPAGQRLEATNPIATGSAESFHALTGLIAGWSVGTAQYKLLADSQLVLLQIIDLVPPASPPSDGTAIWPAGSLPVEYQPVNFQPIEVCYHSGTAGTETPALQVRPNGSIEVYGVGSTSVTRMDRTILYSLV